jgi:molybdate transport system regulatory protein
MGCAQCEAMSKIQLGQALGQTSTDKRVDILRLIARTGSISQAARDAGVSYKAAWQAIDTLTNLARVALVEKLVGGAGGGGARLTPAGQQLLDTAQALEAARQQVLSGAGVLASPGALALRTSMRNQIPCTVTAVQYKGRVVRVVMSLGRGLDGAGDATESPLVSRITLESAELLGLRPGMPVLALFKATAVLVVSAQSQVASADKNTLPGSIQRVARAADRSEADEYAVCLAGGMLIAGFGMAGEHLKKSNEVVACMDETAVVIAL